MVLLGLPEYQEHLSRWGSVVPLAETETRIFCELPPASAGTYLLLKVSSDMKLLSR